MTATRSKVCEQSVRAASSTAGGNAVEQTPGGQPLQASSASSPFDETMAHASSITQNANSVEETQPLSEPSESRYHVLRPHAKGGLGEVAIALDDELNREVALKTIQDRFADDVDSQARFTIEAEVTGSLEHPGIVPVYGFGRQKSGRTLLRDAFDPWRKPGRRDQEAL